MQPYWRRKRHASVFADVRHGNFYGARKILNMHFNRIFLFCFLLLCNSAAGDKYISSRNLIQDCVETQNIRSRVRRSDDDTKVEEVSLNDHERPRNPRSLPTAEGSQSMVDRHNYYRSIIGDEGEEPVPSNMMFMTWDPSLAINSLRYAKKCKFEHSHPDERLTEQFNDWNGENLWAGQGKFATSFDPLVGLESWFMEYVDYDFYTHDCVPGMQCGHYTQVVWSDSYKVGCAWTLCSSFDTMSGEIWTDAMYTVCQYGPGGNEEGTNLYKVGPRCSECGKNDTCPDGRLCRNEKRDVIFPAPSDAGYIAGMVLCILAILALVSAGTYFIYSHKKDFIGAWSKRRKIGHKTDIKSGGGSESNNNENATALPGIQQ